MAATASKLHPIRSAAISVSMGIVPSAKALNIVRGCSGQTSPPGRPAAQSQTLTKSISPSWISVDGQQFVPSHCDACPGYTITVPALSAIA